MLHSWAVLSRSASLRIALLCAVLASCGEDDPTQPVGTAKGSVFVRVRNFNGQPVGGATVLTRPESARGQTDQLGSILLKDLDPGVYVVWATHSVAGSGNAAVTVVANQSINASVDLEPGVFLQPRATIQTPAAGSQPFSYVDSITFSAVVSDLEDEAAALTLRWSSSLDGLLWSTPATPAGVTTFVTDALTNGQHWIRLFVKDTSDFTDVDSVSVTVGPLPPSATIVSPVNEQGFTPGEAVTFRAHVSDRETQSAQLVVAWTSDRDGLLSQAPPDASGNVSFTTTSLTAEQHVVTLRVTDGDNLSNESAITVINLVPPPVDGLEATANRGRVTLNWTPTTDQLFARYEVYRGDSETAEGSHIGSIDRSADATFVDLAAPLQPVAWYRVHVVNTRGYFRSSSRVSVSNPGGLLLTNVPDETLLHPTEDWLYLRFGATIYRVDLVSMTIADTGSLESNGGWMDIGDNGMGVELYAPGIDGWIRVFDASSLNRVSAINTGLHTTSVVIDGNGIVYASMNPNPWWEQPLRTYSRATGFQIDGGGDFSSCRLRMLTSRTEIIEISTGISPTDMDYYRFDSAGNFLEHQNDIPHGGPPLDAWIYKVSPGGSFLITSNVGAVYAANSGMAYLGGLARGSRTFTDFGFDPTGNVIYAAVRGERLVQVYEYPDLQQTAQYVTRGMPRFVHRRGGELILVSELGPSPSAAAVEVVPLPGP